MLASCPHTVASGTPSVKFRHPWLKVLVTPQGIVFSPEVLKNFQARPLWR